MDFLGNLSYDNYTFDLKSINYDIHSNYIKIIFKGDNHKDFIIYVRINTIFKIL